MNNKKYKSTFILDTRGYTEPVETLIERLKSVIESVGCKVRKFRAEDFRAHGGPYIPGWIVCPIFLRRPVVFKCANKGKASPR